MNDNRTVICIDPAATEADRVICWNGQFFTFPEDWTDTQIAEKFELLDNLVDSYLARKRSNDEFYANVNSVSFTNFSVSIEKLCERVRHIK